MPGHTSIPNRHQYQAEPPRNSPLSVFQKLHMWPQKGRGEAGGYFFPFFLPPNFPSFSHDGVSLRSCGWPWTASASSSWGLGLKVVVTTPWFFFFFRFRKRPKHAQNSLKSIKWKDVNKLWINGVIDHLFQPQFEHGASMALLYGTLLPPCGHL